MAAVKVPHPNSPMFLLKSKQHENEGNIRGSLSLSSAVLLSLLRLNTP